jgi:hypothetical protein
VESKASAYLSQAWSSQPVGEDVVGAAPGSRSAFHWATTAANAVAAGLQSISDAVTAGIQSISNAGTVVLGSIADAVNTALQTIGLAQTNSVNAVNTAAAAQLNSISQAIGAKVYASTADALSKGLASVTLGNGGSGASVTGQFPIGTSNGGGTQGLFLVNVAGGTITSIVKILNPGRGYTSAPTTFDTSAIAGLTGATFTATIGQNRVTGDYFATPGAALPALFDFYVVASLTTATLVGSGPDLASVQELRNAGGNRNLHPDPFNTESVIQTGLRGRSDVSPFTFGPNWAIQSAPAASPYQGGKVLFRASANQNYEIRWALEQLEDPILPGDIIEFGAEIAANAATTAVQNLFHYGFYGKEGVLIGALTTIASTSGNPLDTTFRLFRTGAIVVPANAYMFRVNPLWTGVAQGQYWASLQLCRGAIASKPVQRLSVPDLGNRLRTLEANAAANPSNNVLMRRTVYASSVSSFLAGTGTPLGSNFFSFAGLGSSYLAAACPVGGFNAISQTWTWTPSETTGAARITVVVRTAATGANPLNRGKAIAWGYIDCDPTTGSAGTEPIQLFDPATGAPKTVMPADLLDVFSLAFYGTTKSGDLAVQMYANTCSSFSNVDSAVTGGSIPASPIGSPFGKFGPGFGSIGGNVWYPNLLLLTTPVTATRIPSPSFAAAVFASLGDVAPALDSVPAKIWNIVGMWQVLNYSGMQKRAPERTDFTVTYTYVGTYNGNPYTGNMGAQFEEGVSIQETAAGTKNVTIKACIGDVAYATKTFPIVTVAAAAGAGTTRRLLGLGSSLMQNAGLQTEILKLVADTTINPGGAATGMNLVNVGTVGSAPNLNEGRSGQPTGIYFTAGDKFYNGGTFDFANYVATYLAGVPPTDVVFGDPFWDVASAQTDQAALAAAQGAAGRVQQMITSIQAYETTNAVNINKMIWCSPMQPRYGQDGEPRGLGATVSQHQRWSNLRIAAGVYLSTFAGKEAQRIFPLAFNVVGNSDAVTARYQWQPRTPGVKALVNAAHGPYATYAAMVAAANVINDGEIVGDGTAYWVKMGSGVNGGFRPVSEVDGFVRRVIDSTHGTVYREIAQQVYACMKNNL